MLNIEKELVRIGIKVNDKTARYINIIIDDTTTFKVETAISFKMSYNNLVLVYAKIASLGFFGKRVIKALLDAVEETSTTIIDKLRFNYWIENTHKPEEFIEYFMEYFYAIIEKHSVHVQRGKLNPQLMRNLWFSFGGYRGMKTIFKDCIKAVDDEFSRISNLENKYMEACIAAQQMLPATKFGDFRVKKIYVDDLEKNPCITCRHCRVDRHGYRHCNKCMISIPDYLTAQEIAMMYPSGSVKLRGNTLKSDVIAVPIKTCDYRVSRVAYSTWDYANKLKRIAAAKQQQIDDNNIDNNDE